MSLKAATKTDETNRIELEVEVDSEAFDKAVSKTYRKNVKNMNIPGFRKGKAPRHIVETMFGESVFYEDAINDIYPIALDEAIKESEYTYVEDKIDLDVVSVGKDGLVFKAVITVEPEVNVGKYKELVAEKVVEEITDEKIQDEIKELQEKNARLVEIEDRPAEDGDSVVIDFEGFIDGEVFEGGKGENHTLVIGSGEIIPGFEEQIIGKSSGDEFDVEVNFPEDYHAEELAGKAATFKCKLHEIKEKELPEVNDEFVKDVSEFDTVDELKEDLKEKLEEQAERTAEQDFENTLVEQLAEGLTAEIPEAMYESRINQSIQDFEYRLQSQGMNLQMYLQFTGMDMDGFRDTFREQAEKSVKIRLALDKIAQLEDFEITDEDIESEYEKLAEMYSMEAKQIKDVINKDMLVKDIKTGKALDYIKENAVAEEK